jgi:hypothetical protein
MPTARRMKTKQFRRTSPSPRPTVFSISYAGRDRRRLVQRGTSDELEITSQRFETSPRMLHHTARDLLFSINFTQEAETILNDLSFKRLVRAHPASAIGTLFALIHLAGFSSRSVGGLSFVFLLSSIRTI